MLTGLWLLAGCPVPPVPWNVSPRQRQYDASAAPLPAADSTPCPAATWAAACCPAAARCTPVRPAAAAAAAPGEQQRQGCGQQQGPHLQAGAEAAHPAQPARKPEHLQRLAAQAQAAEPPELASQPFASSDGDAFHSRYDAAVLAAERALQAGPEPGDAGRRAAAASRSLESRRSGELAGLQPGSHDTGPGLQLGAEQELQAWGLLPHSSGWPSNGLAWWHTMHMPSAWHLSGALDMASIAC